MATALLVPSPRNCEKKIRALLVTNKIVQGTGPGGGRFVDWGGPGGASSRADGASRIVLPTLRTFFADPASIPPGFAVNLLHDPVHFWGLRNLSRFPDSAPAIGENFLDGVVLCRCEFKRVIEMLDKFLPQHFR